MPAQTPPKKHTELQRENAFSPVSLPQSPGDLASQQNITGLPRVARDIAADLYNTVQKWNAHHIAGAKVVKHIAIMKSDNIFQQYPPGLEFLMKELFDVVQTLSIYSQSLIFLTGQMKALTKLHRSPTPLFISLSIEQLADLVQTVADAYKNEFKDKQYIMENISHSKTKKEVMYFAACWSHQSNITSNVTFKLETILVETGHRRKSHR